MTERELKTVADYLNKYGYCRLDLNKPTLETSEQIKTCINQLSVPKLKEVLMGGVGGKVVSTRDEPNYERDAKKYGISTEKFKEFVQKLRGG